MKGTKILPGSQYKFIEYLIYLHPILFIFSPLLSNLNLAVVSIFGFYYVLKYKPIFFIKNIYIKLFFLFWTVLILSSFISEYKMHSLKSSFFFIKNLFFVISFYLILSKNKNFIKNFVKIFIITYLFLIFDAFIQIYFGSNIFGYELSKNENNRVSGAFGDELILGSYLARNIFIVIGIYTLIYKNNFFILFLTFLTLITVLFTKERAAFYLLTFGLTIYLFFSNFINTKNKFYFLTISIISIFFIFFLSINQTYSRMIKESNLLSFSNKKIVLFTEGHTKHYKTAYEIFKNNKILGIGPNNFRKECTKDKYKVIDGCTTHPHNFYIQILAEVGIVGFSFIFIFFTIILVNLFKNIKSRNHQQKELQLCILISIIINFWPITTSGNFFGSAMTNIYIIPFVFLMLRKIDIKIIK
jgi:O-antigen ligase